LSNIYVRSYILVLFIQYSDFFLGGSYIYELLRPLILIIFMRKESIFGDG